MGARWWTRPKPPVSVQVRAVLHGSVEEVVVATTQGAVRPLRTVQIRASQPTSIRQMAVEEGDRVKEGDLLVQFDDRTVAAQERVAQAQADAASRLAVQAEASWKAGLTPPVELEKIKDSAEISRRQWDSVKVQRSLMRVLAPWGGLVTRTLVATGDSPVVGQPMLELMDDSELHVEARIDETDLPKVKPGQPVRVILEAWPESPLPGEVSSLAPLVTQEPPFTRTLLLDVKLLPGAEGSPVPRPGMSADVEVVVGRGEGLLVPTVALFDRDGARHAWVLEQGVLRDRGVTTGPSNFEQTVVTGGLKEGDRVVMSLQTEGFTDGLSAEAAPAATP